MDIRSNIKEIFYNLVSKPNQDAILLFGLNKSGTTVTINLIAKRAGISFYDDFPYYLAGGFDEVLAGNKTLQEYIKKNSYAFSKDLIRYSIRPKGKEIVWDYFNKNKFLLTVRNPIENIKSILSRLKIPGNLNNIDLEKLSLHDDWKRMLSKKNNYIDSLAFCWYRAYQQFDLQDEQCILFRYEDFKKDKIAYVTQKVLELDLEVKNSIDGYVNVQYQPKGKKKSNLEFFGEDNVERIIELTSDLANKFGYKLK